MRPNAAGEPPIGLRKDKEAEIQTGTNGQTVLGEGFSYWMG